MLEARPGQKINRAAIQRVSESELTSVIFSYFLDDQLYKE